MKKKRNWTVILQTVLLSLAALFVSLEFSISWVFIRSLTNPGCTPTMGESPLPTSADYREIVLESNEKYQLSGRYYPGSNGAAIIIPASLGEEYSLGVPLVRDLYDAGYGLMFIQGRACANPPVVITLGILEADEIGTAVKFLSEQPEVPPDRIGVYGFSMGGAAAILAGAEYSEINAVVALGNYHDLQEKFNGSPETTQGWERSLRMPLVWIFQMVTGLVLSEHTPLQALESYQDTAVFLIRAENEPELEAFQMLCDAAREPKECWEVPGAEHGTYYQAEPEEYTSRVMTFFAEYLLKK